MDSTQQKALSALEPFLLLSKSATTPRSAADLITRATSHPHTYLFAELLQTPNIQSLRDAPPEYSEHLTLLEIYTWGTWADYNRVPDLPPLTDAQTLKLRHLTLLTLCASPLPTTLTYPSLLTSLSIPTPLALETLIISAIYANLLTATLSPLTSRIHVTSIAPLRDPPTNSLPKLISILSDWDRRCMGALRELEAQVQDIRGRAKEERRREREAREAWERAVAAGEGGKSGGKREAGEREGEGGADDEMDVDGGEGRTAKRGGARFRGYGGR